MAEEDKSIQKPSAIKKIFGVIRAYWHWVLILVLAALFLRWVSINTTPALVKFPLVKEAFERPMWELILGTFALGFLCGRAVSWLRRR